jgi:hypothetical protein
MDGTKGMGHQRYHLEQVTTPAEPLLTGSNNPVAPDEQATSPVPENHSRSSSPDVLRTVALILITLGVLLLLLAVWQ